MAGQLASRAGGGHQRVAGVTAGLPPRRIVVTGAESTGKTTLARQLAEALGAPWVPEYARAYALSRGGTLLESDVEPIARGQLAAETRALLLEAPQVVFDTDLLSTAVYAEHYYGWCPAWVREAAMGRLGLYLLLDIDVPFRADPTRGPANRRAELHRRFLEFTEAAGVRRVVIAGSWEERLARALAAVRHPGEPTPLEPAPVPR